MNNFNFDKDKEFTLKDLYSFIKEHQKLIPKYKKLNDFYIGKHEILERESKGDFKPNNKLVVNFAKYIVDTINGFFIGVPIKTTHSNEDISNYIEFIEKYNNQDDNNSELSKKCSIYGHAFELLFLDENANVGITYISPEECFIIYDNSILEKPLFGIRYTTNKDNKLQGTYSDNDYIYYFIENDKGLTIVDTKPNYFSAIPLIEYVENEEKQSAFQNVITLINAYNKAISEKANDVDYYADAYLKILGAELEEKQLKDLRDYRIINLVGSNERNIVIDFMSKPNADTTQENLINRLEKEIYYKSMVPNINDENFGNASGISLEYKLQALSNLCNNKERKFIAGMNERWKLISNIPNSKMNKEDWLGIKYRFTRNIPKNELEETQIATALSGIVSKETQLKVLSIVDDVKEEINQMEKENIITDDYGVYNEKHPILEE